MNSPRPSSMRLESLPRKQTMPMLSDQNPLTNVPIAELWPRLRGRSSNGGNGTQSPDSSPRKVIRTRSPLGTRTLPGCFTSSTCVRFVLFDIRELSGCFSDRIGNRYPYDGCRHTNGGYKYPNDGCEYPDDSCGYPSERLDDAGRSLRPKPPGRYDSLFI